MTRAGETRPVLPATRQIDLHEDRVLAGGESDLELWGDWPEDELVPPSQARSERLTAERPPGLCDG